MNPQKHIPTPASAISAKKPASASPNTAPGVEANQTEATGFEIRSPGWRLSLSAWLALFGLGLAGWLTILYSTLIVNIGAIVFAAFLLSLAIRPLAIRLAAWRIPRGLTVLGIYLALFGLLSGLGTLLVPVVSAEIELVRANGPALVQQAANQLSTLPLLSQWATSLTELTQNLTQYTGTLAAAVLSTVAGAGELSLDVLVVLVLAYFFAADGTLGEQLVGGLTPARHQAQVRLVLARLHQRLSRWVWAQLAVALYFAVAFGLGLVVLGVPFAPTIALVGGVIEIIPYVGGATALLIGVMSGLTVSPWLALWVLGWYVVVAQVQSHIIAPTFYGRAIHLHPAAVLVTLLIGAKVGGIAGVFFAVPLAVVLVTLLQEIRQQGSNS